MHVIHALHMPQVRRSAAGWLAVLFTALCLATGVSAQTPQIGIDSNLTDNQQVANTIRVIGFALTPGSTGVMAMRASHAVPWRRVPPLR